ncbi:MAG: hypothetical protein M1812_002843 [Candelaria pacifica]|nr:MAG: hypothetical protein M1812_002843 [Candelaria pacifica]
MKVIVADATNYVGYEILQRCISHPSITSILAFSSSLTLPPHPKTQLIDLAIFENYPETFLPELEGAKACFWSLGDGSVLEKTVPWSGQDIMNTEITLKAAEAIFNGVVTKLSFGQRMRFVRCDGWDSGVGEMEESPVEQGLFDLANRNNIFEAYAIRPAIRPGWENQPIVGHRLGPNGWEKAPVMCPRLKAHNDLVADHRIAPDDLALAMIEIGLRGAKREIWGHLELQALAKKVKARKPPKPNSGEPLSYAEVASRGARVPGEAPVVKL